MDHKYENIEETLWSYIDGALQDNEAPAIEQLILENAAWKARYAELMEIHQIMQDNADLEKPSMRFTQNVMEEISRLYITPATRKYIDKNIIRGIGLFFLTTIIGLLVYGLAQMEWQPSNKSYSFNLNLEEVRWSSLFNTYTSIFITINIVLGLMLLDMYLTRKKTGTATAKR